MHSKAILLTVMMVAVALSPMFGFADASDGASLDGILIYEVNPNGTSEGVSIYNYGLSAADLKGYSVSDGEGSVEFKTSYELQAKTRLTIVAAITEERFASRDNVISYDDPALGYDKAPVLSNGGDDIYLFNGSELVDAVCYGDKTTEQGWSGASVKISSERFLLRLSDVDTDTAADWKAVEYGWTNLMFDPAVEYDAAVTPFTFPESGGTPILQTIDAAKSTVDICIYELPSKKTVALLIDLEKRTGDEHVDVRVLLEGSPFGYDTSTELSLMAALEDAGGDVRLIDGGKAVDRYSYVHAKYAVIDGIKTIITTENWTTANMGESGTPNRGWGVVVDSAGYSGYMSNIFENDWSTEYGDVGEIPSSVTAYDGKLTYTIQSDEYQSYSAKVTPVLSPDSSYDGQKYYVSQAKERVYAEELDLSASFVSSTEISPASPVAWLADAAGRGIDTRFILDASQNTDHIAAVALINEKTSVKACTIDGYKGEKGESFGTTHNKGLIIDDAVWVGSVNWTPNSFDNNRESAVYIKSAEVADYFLSYFMADWNRNYTEVTPTSLAVTTDSMMSAGDSATFVVNNETFGTFIWDVYGDGTLIKSTTVAKLVVDGIAAGTYTIKVSDSASGLLGECTYTVSASASDANEFSIPTDKLTLAEIAAAILLILMAIIGFVRRSRKGKRH